ncbi:MAG: type II toxin-antitoxin system HicA family toxin [Coriobacteriaceae bacterium]|nr:type II toxin-antitoxin system HicA family toxin [Coriobacteriaceae bacterium]
MPLTYRSAVKLIKENGGVFVRHGANHDLYCTADGKIISVPRHPGDLSAGVERSIKRALGLL